MEVTFHQMSTELNYDTLWLQLVRGGKYGSGQPKSRLFINFKSKFYDPFTHRSPQKNLKRDLEVFALFKT